MEVTAKIKQLSTRVIRTLQDLIHAILVTKIPEEFPSNLFFSSFQVSLQKQFPDTLANYTYKAGSKASLVIPIGIDEFKNNEYISIQAINYQLNPYNYSLQSTNISSTVLSIAFKTSTNAEIAIDNTSAPFKLSIPGTFDSSMLIVGCLLRPTNTAVCKFWQTDQEIWSTKGCKLEDVSDTHVTCSCNHLTDFAGFVEQLTPEMNILTAQDLIAQLNPDNLLTLVVVICIAVLYCIFLIVCYVADWLFEPSDIERRNQIELIVTGKWRMFLEAMKREHVWLSVFLRPVMTKTFTRPQRLTILYMLILINFTTNALFFGTNQVTPVRIVAATLIAQITCIPAYLFMAIFQATRTSNDMKRPVKTIPHEMFNDVGQYEVDEMMHKNFYPESKVQLFKAALNTIMARNDESNNSIPKLVQHLVTYIEHYPTRSDLFTGIGDKHHVKLLVYKLDQGEDVNYLHYHIHTVCDVLLRWLNELSDPVLTYAKYQQFATCGENARVTHPLEQIRTLVDGLPKPHYEMLKRIILACSNMADTDAQIAHFASVFAPVLAKPKRNENEHKRNMEEVIEVMILNYSALFEQEKSQEHAEQSSVVHRPRKNSQRVTSNRTAALSVNTVRNQFKHETQRKLTKVLNVGDEVLNKADAVIDNLTSNSKASAISWFILLLVAAFYMVAISSALVIMELVFYRNWTRYLTSLVVCLAFIVPLAGFQALYFVQKRKLFRLERVWHISIPGLVFVGIMAVAFFAMAVISISVACGILFWTLPYGIQHTTIIAVSQLLLCALCISFIILSLYKPQIVVLEVTPKDTSAKLPPWSIVILYPLAWLFIGILSWIMVQYSIKFGADKANNWIRACFLGLAQSVFFTSNIFVFIKVVFLDVLLKVMDFLFFKSRNTTILVTSLDSVE